MEDNTILNTGSSFEPKPGQFISKIFESQAYYNGRTVKRSVASVERWSSESALYAEAHRRGLKVAKVSGEYILLPRYAVIEWNEPAFHYEASIDSSN